VNCAELIEKLMDYLDGELVEEQRTTVKVHLDGCQNCTFILESYTHTVRVVKKLPRCGKLPETVEARLREVLKDHLGKGG
jgi:mycothiol system anti-sigma-R factor